MHVNIEEMNLSRSLVENTFDYTNFYKLLDTLSVIHMFTKAQGLSCCMYMWSIQKMDVKIIRVLEIIGYTAVPKRSGHFSHVIWWIEASVIARELIFKQRIIGLLRFYIIVQTLDVK